MSFNLIFMVLGSGCRGLYLGVEHSAAELFFLNEKLGITSAGRNTLVPIFLIPLFVWEWKVLSELFSNNVKISIFVLPLL